ncbi:MAG: hypothetical protein M1371_03930 [Actinobacteria bacterium]|nr:hypothetical protein [Actinomycetota bacterium]
MDLEKYRSGVEGFLGEMDYEYYLHCSGQKEELNLSALYRKYEPLFSVEVNSEIKDLYRTEHDKEEKRRLAQLLIFSTEYLIGEKVKEQKDRFSTREAEATINIDGEKVSYRYSSVMQMNEPEQEKRALIDSKRNEVTSVELNPILVDYWSKIHQITKELGYKNYLEMFSLLKEIDYMELSVLLNQILGKTNELYIKIMDAVLRREIGLSLKETKRSDMPFLIRGKRFDEYFKKDRLVESFHQTMKGLGIDLNEQKNIILDIEARGKKSPRAFCSIVRIPSEIYLCIMPSGGQDDYQAFLHEGGHAEHFANVSAKLPVEFRYLGDNSVTEGFAFLLENLLKNRVWLKKMLFIDDSDRYSSFSKAIDLMMLRRYVTKLQYEIRLHDGSSLDGKSELYKDILYRSAFLEYPAENYLKDVDESMYCANYLRAWVFEAQLRAYLEGRFGEAWFENKKAGDMLREIWYYGQKYKVEEILGELGLSGLLIEPLLDIYMS